MVAGAADQYADLVDRHRYLETGEGGRDAYETEENRDLVEAELRTFYEDRLPGAVGDADAALDEAYDVLVEALGRMGQERPSAFRPEDTFSIGTVPRQDADPIEPEDYPYRTRTTQTLDRITAQLEEVEETIERCDAYVEAELGVDREDARSPLYTLVTTALSGIRSRV